MESSKISGQCLCGEVQFFIEGEHFGIYQCHCSECRRITGSTANSSCIVPVGRFAWVKGESKITSYIHESGYRSDFCSRCGSAVPSIMRNGEHFWVPAGALEDVGQLAVAAHLCVASKARWETSPSDGIRYEAVPAFEELAAALGVARESSGQST